ncbi:hypothetical protein [Streptomyces orinoci]|uniref:Uncharacterized protein n=1 Tax=Streptomyces orinoci TaxID=67339 RepID=A0ABV3K0U3_STRON|nr:hypothetical protein [Streptomyces orinoci]
MNPPYFSLGDFVDGTTFASQCYVNGDSGTRVDLGVLKDGNQVEDFHAVTSQAQLAQFIADLRRTADELEQWYDRLPA